MKTEETSNFTDNIIEGLKKTATELEELRVQFALGKAEAHDKIDASQKKLKQYVQHAKNKLENLKDKTNAEAINAKTEIETVLKDMYDKI